MSRDALVVGINQYHHLYSLNSAAQDAQDVAELLSQYGRFRIQRLPEQVDPFDGSLRVSRRQNVTLTTFKEALVKLFKPEGQHIPDTALLFFSGHGLREDQGIQEGFLATSDANPDMGFYGVSLQWLRRLMEESPIKQQVVWLDCCYSGELMNFKQILADTHPATGEEHDCSFISACREFELSYEQQQGSHGILTDVLLQGLDPTHRSDGWVTNYTLTDRIKEQLSTEVQCPIFQNQGKAIVLANATNIRYSARHADDVPKTFPYKALNFFQETDADFFYGRTRFTDELIQSVAKNNFVAVIGPSGSGKSSAVRAGLLHQLKLGQKLTGSHAWKYLPIMTPGEHPATSLEQMTGITLSALQSSVVMAPTQRVVIVIDQFEECFTLCQSHEERQAFFGSLLSTLNHASPKFCLIIAMRADFLGHCTEYSTLAQLMDRPMTIKPMNELELREAITQPATKVGLEVEPQLVTHMVDDVIRSPGSLPLLQFALTILWETRQEPYKNTLTLYAYDQLGGIKGALEQVANNAYDALSDKEKAIAKRLFLELTQLGVGTEDTRRRVLKQDLVAPEQPEAVLDPVIQKLVTERLIITDKAHVKGSVTSSSSDVVIDVAHEALIRHWSKLRRWIDQNQVALKQQRDIQDAAKKWEDRGKPLDGAFLLRGSQLELARAYVETHGAVLPLSALAQDYLKTSHRVEQRTRRIRIGAIATGVTGICIAALIAMFQAVRAIDQAILSTANSSVKLLRSGNQLEALYEGVKAGTLQRDAVWTSSRTQLQTLAALQQAIQGLQEINRLDNHTDVVRSVDIAADDDIMVTGSWDQSVKLWQTDGTLLWSQNHDAQVMSVRFSPDGQVIIASDLAGTIRRWDRDGNSLGSTTFPVRVASVAVSPTGTIMAIAGGKSREVVQLLDRETNSIILTLTGHQDTVTDVQFSPDGAVLASASEDGTVKLWDVETGSLQATYDQHQDAVTSVSFHGDGDLIASGDRWGDLHLWKFDGQSIQPTAYQVDPILEPISEVAFSPNGQLLAVATVNGPIYLFPLGSGEFLFPLETFQGHEGMVQDLDFDTDGHMLASVGDDGTVRLWQIRSTWHEGIINDIAFSPDGSMYASVGSDRTIRLWNAHDQSLITTLENETYPVRKSLVFNWDQQYLWTSNHNQIERWNLTTGVQDKTLTEHEGYINAAAISVDGDLLASVGQDSMVKLWDTSDGSLLHTVEGHTDEILTVEFSPDGQWFATGGWDNTIRLWNVETQELVQILTRPGQEQSHDHAVYDVAFHPNGRQLASVGLDGVIQHWSIPNGQWLDQWPMPQTDMARIAFSPDGKTLASTSNTNIVLWDVESGTAIATYAGHSRGLTSLAFSPDGSLLLSGGSDRRIMQWAFDLDQLLHNACYYLQDYLQSSVENAATVERNRSLCRS